MKPFSRFVHGVGAFLNAATKSCWDMEWYRAVRDRPLASALRYTVLFDLMATFFVSAVLASSFFGAETAFIVHAVRTFPRDAAITVKGGQLSTNLSEPFEAGSNKWMRVVIDTSVEGDEVPAKYSDLPGALVGRDAIFMPKSSAGTSGFLTHRGFLRVKSLPDVTVTRSGVLEGLRIWGGLVILAALLVYNIVSGPYLIIKTVLLAAVVSAIAVPLGRAFGATLSYKKWLAVCLYASTLPTVLGLAAWAVGLRSGFPFMLLVIVFVAAVIADEFSRSATRWTPTFFESMFFSSGGAGTRAPAEAPVPATAPPSTDDVPTSGS